MFTGDLTSEQGKQDYENYIMNNVRNEINSYTKQSQANSVSSGAGSLTSSVIIPTGLIVPFAGGPGVTPNPGTRQDVPDGWLLCSNVAVSRTAYSALFTIIGTTYGVGDGSTTFNVPDLRGRVLAGKDDMGGATASRVTSVSGITGTTLGAVGGDQRIQDHTHTYSGTTGNDSPDHNHAPASGGNSFFVNVNSGGDVLNGGGSNYRFNFGSPWTATAGAHVRHQHAYSGTTANHNQTAGGASQNMPPTIITNYIIKT